jgi:hypothetical protein
MKLSELIEMLNDFAAGGDDPEVLIATQPAWPMQTDIAAVTLVDGKLFIAEGTPPWDSPYAPRAAWDGGIAGEGDD